ncbi:hypothetical protein BLNAU_3513 [Blattamonas nauphoetae]|uniref:Uncharacterized protein n=1 Tax=Blattamonas nauphoetae TaxID=2049346 RepID=A0ABQ9YC95_9EUKA|nr:hypothetical protein BLNAU_3513 [Blattamonas nauphoetae]
MMKTIQGLAAPVNTLKDPSTTPHRVSNVQSAVHAAARIEEAIFGEQIGVRFAERKSEEEGEWQLKILKLEAENAELQEQLRSLQNTLDTTEETSSGEKGDAMENTNTSNSKSLPVQSSHGSMRIQFADEPIIEDDAEEDPKPGNG